MVFLVGYFPKTIKSRQTNTRSLKLLRKGNLWSETRASLTFVFKYFATRATFDGFEFFFSDDIVNVCLFIDWRWGFRGWSGLGSEFYEQARKKWFIQVQNRLVMRRSIISLFFFYSTDYCQHSLSILCNEIMCYFAVVHYKISSYQSFIGFLIYNHFPNAIRVWIAKISSILFFTSIYCCVFRNTFTWWNIYFIVEMRYTNEIGEAVI